MAKTVWLELGIKFVKRSSLLRFRLPEPMSRPPKVEVRSDPSSAAGSQKQAIHQVGVKSLPAEVTQW